MNDGEWRRLSLPGLWAFVCLVFVVGLLVVSRQAVVVCFLNQLDPAIREAVHFEQVFDTAITAVCCIFVVLAGLIRCSRFPTPKNSYGQWLAQTAWTPNQRLPFGPWTPIREDFAILLALAVLLALVCRPMFWFAPCATYALLWVSVGFSNGLVAYPTCAYSFTISVPVLVHVVVADSRSSGLLGVMLIGFAVTLSVLGLRCLTRNLSKLAEVQNEQATTWNSKSVAGSVHDVMRRRDQLDSRWAPKRALKLAVPLFLILSLPPWQIQEAEWLLPMFCMLVVLVMVIVRLGVFTNAAASFGWSARWAMRRLVIPSHDIAYVAPFVMALTGLMFAFLGYHHFVPPQLAYPLGIVLAGVIGLCGGPNRHAWTLTAPVTLRLRSLRRESHGPVKLLPTNQHVKTR